MITNPSKLIRNFQQIFRNYSNKYYFKMNQAYLRHLNETNQFEFSFQYTNPELKVNKSFNFARSSTESVESFLSRITTNVEKFVNKKRKKLEPIQIPTKLLYLDNNIQVNSEIKCEEIFQETYESKIKLCLMNEEYQIIINSPWINSLNLPKTSMLANYPVFPTKFQASYTDYRLSEYKWFKSNDQKKWIEIPGNSIIYTPSDEDIGYYLKLVCTPRNNTKEGPSIEVVSNCAIQPGPIQKQLEPRYKLAKEKPKESVFRIVSYNILADLYCDSDYTRTVLHPYCPPYALAFDYRRPLIVKELLNYNADIICLQEVDQKFYDYDLQQIFKYYLNYDGTYCRKSGTTAEGLACFYDNTKYKLLQSERMVLSENISTNPIFRDIWEKIEKNRNLSTRILDCRTVLQVTVLECFENGNILIVANTHLYFHPDADHIRLIQGGVIIRFLENFSKEMKKLYQDRTISLIICGDFNSVPNCGIFKLYTTGFVSEDFIDFQSNKEEIVEGLNLKQSFNLDSACGTPQYTNFTAGFGDCLDYIYYEKENLAVEQVFPFPTVEELREHTALPSIVFPSDHLSLVCDLKWR